MNVLNKFICLLFNNILVKNLLTFIVFHSQIFAIYKVPVCLKVLQK